jgi:sugar phosphate isomerase/epimerase
MKMRVSDWSDPARAMDNARIYNVGIELQDFIFPGRLDAFESVVPQVAALVDADLLGSLHGPFQDLVPASNDPKIRLATKERFLLAGRISTQLRISQLVLHSGFIPKTYPPKEWLENSVRFWTELISEIPAELSIHIENVYEDDFVPLKELIDAVSRTQLSICLDVGHVNANSSRSVAEWIRGLGQRIQHVHLHNNHGRLDEHLRLSAGSIRMKRALALLCEFSPKASWTIETLPDETASSLDWLCQQGYLDEK